MVIVDNIDRMLDGIGDRPASRSDRFRRNSLLVFREKFESSVPPVKLELGDRPVISASDLAKITKALQDATAKAAILIRNPKVEHRSVTAEWLEKAALFPRSQSGNVVMFDFATPVARPTDALDVGPGEPLAEQAIRELLGVLPESTDDQRTLEALPGRRAMMRSAVSTLASAVNATRSMTLSLRTTGDTTEQSVLTMEQAREVPELLSATEVERSTVDVSGLLDGMRTRRQLFYIIEDETGHEFVGSVERDQLSRLQEAMTEHVDAVLERAVNIRADGSRSRPAYSLLSLRPSQPPLTL
jgi:hypothetical protein